MAAAVVCQGFARPSPLAVPTLDDPAMHGFSATVTIEPRVWEENKIFKALYGNIRPAEKKVDPSVHFAPLIRRMKQDGGY